MIAKPTLTSAAATTIIKKTNNCASVANAGILAATLFRCIFEKATNKRLTELSISSMHMKMIIAFLLVKAPMMPIQKRMTDK